MNTIVHSLFGNPVTFYKLNVNNKKILNFLKKLKFKQTGSTLNKNSDSCFITESMDIFKNKELFDLKKECLKSIDHYISNIVQYNIKYKIVNSWATQVFKNGFSQAHHHAHTLFSAVYYPKYHKYFKIRFIKTKTDFFWELPVKEYNMFNSDTWFFNPEEGDLLIFPSNLVHQIEKNLSEEMRYSIAFNINPVGVIGESDNQLKFD